MSEKYSVDEIDEAIEDVLEDTHDDHYYVVRGAFAMLKSRLTGESFW